MESSAYHIPVMLDECLEGLNIKETGIYVDVTFGGGGHSKAIAEKLSTGKVIAFDRDADAIKNKVTTINNLTVIHSSFSDITNQLHQLNITRVDGVLADLGVSSHQFDQPERGFSFRFDSPLDMRMDKRQKFTAADLLNQYHADRLKQIFSLYGELRNAGTVARTIVEFRKNNVLQTTTHLKQAIGHLAPKKDESRFFAQLYQALRIEVNGELKELEMLLSQLPELVNQGGRICMMSYHSIEDRLVKNFIATGFAHGTLQKDIYGNISSKTFAAVTKKPVEPSESEKQMNPRSRSARLRIAQKI
jgi:16S rRNA (cytosine1402-N4)-methyltransferase